MEEGQTIVRCEYCHTTSYLPRQAAMPAAPPVFGPMAHGTLPTATRVPGASRAAPSQLTYLIIGFVVLLLAGGFFGLTWLTASDLDHWKDGEAAGALLEDKFGKDARYLHIYLQQRYMYVKVLESKSKVVARRVRGRELDKREPVRIGKDEQPDKDAFQLKDVDLRKVKKITKHARKRAAGGKLVGLTLERNRPHQADLLWKVALDVAGTTQLHYYGLDGKPLAESEVDFTTATPSDLGKQLSKKLGFKPKVTAIYINANSVMLTVVTEKNPRDTDRYRFTNDGVMSGATPNSNDGDAAALAATAFSLDDVSWAALPKMSANALKRFDGKLQAVQLSKRHGTLSYRIGIKNERGAYRYVAYDAAMKVLEESKP
jgi:hypothetical protein